MKSFLLSLIAFCSVTFSFAQDPIDHWETVVPQTTQWQYLVPDASTSSSWINTSFPATGWTIGMSAIGYGDGDDNTVVPAGTISVYMRKSFSIIDTSQIEEAILHVDHDDAFVAYLNGVEIARNNIGTVGVQPVWNDPAGGFHEASLYQGLVPESYVISKATLAALLVNGVNVLALEVHNESAGSSDLTANAILSIGIDNPSVNYDPLPSWFVPPFVFVDSNLPLIIISTNSQTIQDDPRIVCDMGIIDNGPGNRNALTDLYNNYNGKIAIEIRGSSSQGFPKKSYALETQDLAGNNLNASLLGMPSENDWILYAPYTDKTMLRDALAYRLGREMGHYAPRYVFAELFINGQYMGVYCLEEKIKRDANRVDIANLTYADTLGDELTGGYILKIDRNDGPGSYFTSAYNGSFNAIEYVYNDPEWQELHPSQLSYIENFIHDFEDAAFGPDYTDPQLGYRAYADVASFIDYFLVNELSNNVDGYRLSSFLYKDKNSVDSLLHMGPLWDYNLTFGNADYCNGQLTSGWSYQNSSDCGGDVPLYWARFLTDTNYANQLKCRYEELRTTIYTETFLHSLIDSFSVQLNESQNRNYQQWPILGTYVWPNPIVWNTYQEEIDYLKQWISDRLLWLDANMPGNCIPDVSSVVEMDLQTFNVFPNPVHDQLMIQSSGQLIARAELINLNGQVVERIHPNASFCRLSVSSYPPGLYSLRVYDLVGSVSSTRIVISR